MTEYNAEQILYTLEKAIKRGKLIQPEPVSGDKWLLSSAMQKAIRRGDIERAERAAASLWYQDRVSFWRRLHIVALEDVGVASNDIVIAVLTATSSSAWRRKIGDLRVGLFLVRLLCKSVKTRIADELLLQAERSSSYSKLRKHFANASDNLLIDYVTDMDCSLVERSLALWYLHGTTKRLPSELIPPRKGNPEKAIEVLRSLSVPTELTESCISVMSRTPYPLALFTPLCWQEVHKQKTIKIRKNTIPASLDVDGLPLYAVDVFTRVGQSCFRGLQKAVPELKLYSVRQIGIAVFYIEGGLLDKVISSKFLDEFCTSGEFADAEGAGLSVPDYLELRELLAKNFPLLESIRTEQLNKYLNGAV